MPVDIRGKQYKTVAERVNEFRSAEQYQGYAILTEIVSNEGGEAIIKASITDPNGFTVATGLAHEVQGAGNINSTSHIENCETSAVGRALANLGLAGQEFASADEVATAIKQQGALEAQKHAHKHMQSVVNNWSAVDAIKSHLATEGDIGEAAQVWFELPDEVKADLWVAPTKGGVFTTEERELIKSTAFRQSYYGADND